MQLAALCIVTVFCIVFGLVAYVVIECFVDWWRAHTKGRK